MVLRSVLSVLLVALCANFCAAQKKTDPQILAKIDKAYQDAKWDDLSIEFRIVEEAPKDGYTKMKIINPDVVKEEMFCYVSQTVEMGLKDFSGIGVFYYPWMADNFGISIFFNKTGREKFTKFTSENVGRSFGVVIDGKLMSVIKIAEPMKAVRVQVISFEPSEAKSIVKRFFEPLRSVWQYFHVQ